MAQYKHPNKARPRNTSGLGCGKSAREVMGGNSFSNLAGKKEAINRISENIRKTSIANAASRTQNPAYNGCHGEAGLSGGLGISSAGGALGATLTNPSCPTVTGVPHCAQELVPSGISAPHFSQFKIAALRPKPQATYQPRIAFAIERSSRDLCPVFRDP